MPSAALSDASDIATVASIVAGFASSALVFRLQRHLEQLPLEPLDHSWLPVADWLLMAANSIALLFVITPLLVLDLASVRIPRAACAAACVLLAGYVFAIQAHYRLIFGGNRRYQTPPVRRVTSTAETILSMTSIAAAIGAFITAYLTLP